MKEGMKAILYFLDEKEAGEEVGDLPCGDPWHVWFATDAATKPRLMKVKLLLESDDEQQEGGESGTEQELKKDKKAKKKKKKKCAAEASVPKTAEVGVQTYLEEEEMVQEFVPKTAEVGVQTYLEEEEMVQEFVSKGQKGKKEPQCAEEEVSKGQKGKKGAQCAEAKVETQKSGKGVSTVVDEKKNEKWKRVRWADQESSSEEESVETVGVQPHSGKGAFVSPVRGGRRGRAAGQARVGKPG